MTLQLQVQQLSVLGKTKPYLIGITAACFILLMSSTVWFSFTLTDLSLVVLNGLTIIFAVGAVIIGKIRDLEK